MSEQQLPLQYSWKISRGSSDFKINFFVEAERNGIKGVGEIAPNIRYHETPEKTREEFNLFSKEISSNDLNLDELGRLLDSLEISSSLRFGIESSLIHLLCNEKGIPVYNYFGLKKPDKIPTARSLPIMPADELKDFWKQYKLSRFKILKVKVNQETALETLEAIRDFTSQPLIVDANESWTEANQVEQVLKKLAKFPIIVFEQPFPVDFVDEYKYLKKISPFPLFADESITLNPDFNLLEQQFHGVNVKLMKAGGYINALNQLKEARASGLKTMLGCMVETSVGISSALQLSSLADIADLDGFMILKEEPFGLVKERDGFISLT